MGWAGVWLLLSFKRFILLGREVARLGLSGWISMALDGLNKLCFYQLYIVNIVQPNQCDVPI